MGNQDPESRRDLMKIVLDPGHLVTKQRLELGAVTFVVLGCLAVRETGCSVDLWPEPEQAEAAWGEQLFFILTSSWP